MPNPAHTHDHLLSSRVDRVEVSLNSLHEDFAGIKSDVRSLAQSVSSGFEAMRKESVASKQTNWGWIAAFIGVGVALMGYMTSALVEPLKTKDTGFESRILDIRQGLMASWELTIRNDERIKVMDRKQP